MRFRFTIDWQHWMIGFTLSIKDFTSMVSIGPLNIWIYNERRAIRTLTKQIEKEMEQRGE